MEMSDFEKALSNVSNKPEDSVESLLADSLNAYYSKKTVLGVDVYRYSKYRKHAQTLIPFLLHRLYTDTVKDLTRYEQSFFADLSIESFKDHFIDNGDGGFIIFDTPFHALFFAVYLALNFLRYNTKKLFPEVYDIVGDISLRYALTRDDVFQFQSNWYGPSIITCARILGRDKLNRFLIDEEVKTWFDHEMNGIETLICLGINNLQNEPVHDQIVKDKSSYKSLLMPEQGSNPGNSNIVTVNLSKIGAVESKGDLVSVYNLHLQSYLVVASLAAPNRPQKFIVTLGNLNPSGL